MMRLFFFGLFFLTHLLAYDVNIIGFLNDAKSLSRHTSTAILCLKGSFPLKILGTRSFRKKDLADFFNIDACRNAMSLQEMAADNPDQALTGVTIYTDNLILRGYADRLQPWPPYSKIRNESSIKFVYCVTEHENVYEEERDLINGNFDAVLVPDEWLIGIYRDAGVTLPIFVMPLALELEPLLEKKITRRPKKPFVFGFSGAFWHHKNHIQLMKAFRQAFGSNPDVELHVHGRFGPNEYAVKKFHQNLRAKNIRLTGKTFSRSDYEDFIKSIDCFISISGGEGFSIIPREAMAAGIPCIISNHSAHSTICNTGLVYPIPAKRMLPNCCKECVIKRGHMFVCSTNDVAAAMQYLYKNYWSFSMRLPKAREWAKQYTPESLAMRYCNLVKPKKVILSNRDELNENYVMTTSKKLFDKYKELLGNDVEMTILK